MHQALLSQQPPVGGRGRRNASSTTLTATPSGGQGEEECIKRYSHPSPPSRGQGEEECIKRYSHSYPQWGAGGGGMHQALLI